MSDKNKVAFYRELETLLKAGVDFGKALDILQGQAATKDREIIVGIREKVVRGTTIFESVKSSGAFSPYEYYSIRIGEETRRLEEVLSELKNYFTQRVRMKRQVVSVVTYPAIVLLVTAGVLYFMLNKVVPMFASVFRQFGSDLPASTQVILSLSRHSGVIFLLFALVLVAAVAVHFTFRNRSGYRLALSAMVLKLPYFGPLVRKIYLARFCQAMGLLTGARTTLLNALSLTGEMIGFYPLETALTEMKEAIKRGASLSESMRNHGIFEKKLISMIEVAEQVNEIDRMFPKMADQYNDEVEHKAKMIGVVLEPFIIIVIGLVVGVIMISMYAPMFDLSKIIKS